MTIEIRVLDVDSASVLENVADDVFDEPVQMDLVAQFISDPRHHLAVALHDEIVVAFASALDYVNPDKPRALWVNEVGVASPYQRQGIGRRLMHALIDQARHLGCYEVWVGTEPDNKAACGLYESLGCEREDMVMYVMDLASGSATVKP